MRTWLDKSKKGVVVDNSARLTKLVVWFGLGPALDSTVDL